MQNGIYTIQNMETGEHRTFRVKTQKDDARFAPGERVVALLTGPDNGNDYRGFGFVNGNEIALWRSKRTPAFRHYKAMLETAAAVLPEGDTEYREEIFQYFGRPYKVMMEVRCRRCNRRLTTPESIRRGLGPECADAMGLAG